jgi:hypothetical protein
VIIDRLAGAVKAALAPFRKRVITSSVPSLTVEPSAEATRNTLSAASSVRRRPNKSAVRPPSSSSPP